MINELNYRFPVMVLSAFGRFTGKSEDTKTFKSIVKEVKKIAAEAAQEKAHAETTKVIFGEASDEKQRRTFAAIAVWHYERSAKKYQSAAEKLDSILQLELSKRNTRYLQSKSNEFFGFSTEIKRQAEQIQIENQK